MAYEVEILARVLEDKEQMMDLLKKYKGGQLKEAGISLIHDIYFSDDISDDNRHGLNKGKDGIFWKCCRIRTSGEQAWMTFKVNHADEKGVWLYSDEFETEISDPFIAQRILEGIGLKVLVKIENERRVFCSDKYEIVLEDVKDLGLFIEVECKNVSEGEDIDNLKKKIRIFLDSLDFKYEELNKGKPELMLEKLKDKNRKE